jgi:hypothetical protein
MNSVPKFFLADTLINPPLNWEGTSIEINFEKDNPFAQTTLNDWDFRIENAEIINKYISDGEVGGVGIFEGIPFRIEIEKNGVVHIPFNGYLDLPELKRISCEEVNVTAKEKQRIDWLNDVADSFTFEYLASDSYSGDPAAQITPNDYVIIPYVINSIPNYTNAAIAVMGVFSVSAELYRAEQELEDKLASLANPLEASALVRVAIYLSYLILLLITLIKLLSDLIRLIIQPIKYHAGMKAVDLLTKGAAFLGLTFKSSIFAADYKDMVIMPEKYNPPYNSDSGLLGFLDPVKNEKKGHYKGSFGALLREMKVMFNAKVVITTNKEIIFERHDYNLSAPTFTMPDVYQPFYSFNGSELQSNVEVSFAVDVLEKNTIVQYKGTSYQVTTRPVKINDPYLVLTKGLSDRNIGFALAKRKENLTYPEIIIKEFADAFSFLINGLILGVNAIIEVYNDVADTINGIIKTLNFLGISINITIPTISPLDPIDLGELIGRRVGMLNLDSDFTNVAKCFIMEFGADSKKNKIASSNATLLSAKYLYETHHYIDSFVPTADRPAGNQFIIKELDEIILTFDDYIKIKENNFIVDAQGNTGRIDSLKWNIWKEDAQVRYRINKLYTNNLKETYYEPDGS